MIAQPRRDKYPAVNRNGVIYNNYDYATAAIKSSHSFRFAPATQPIAASIQSTGQAQLYIQFRFNSAELDDSAIPTLSELRDTLNAMPNLNLRLVGHTDAIGTADYNLALSWRRAQSVMNWLIAAGISQSRLSIDGKGFTQPIADNDTEQGRALNRRVQAIRVQ